MKRERKLEGKGSRVGGGHFSVPVTGEMLGPLLPLDVKALRPLGSSLLGISQDTKRLPTRLQPSPPAPSLR